MTKRIRLTIEWDGARSEESWATVLRDQIEDFDTAGLTRVLEPELLTNYGYTPAPILRRKRRSFGRLLRWLR